MNFLGLRHITERTLDGMMSEGGAVAHVASKAGSGWRNHLPSILEVLATPDLASGTAWAAANLGDLGDPYFFSKECVVVYTMKRAHELFDRGIRMNCLSPGPIDSPMMPKFREALGSALLDWTADQVGRMGRPDEMAGPLVFLNSDEASYVNGLDLIADAGFTRRDRARPRRPLDPAVRADHERSAAAVLLGEAGRLPRVAAADVGAGRHDLVDRVEGRRVEAHVGARERVVELLHRPRPDDRRRHVRVLEHERVGQVREADARLARDLQELLDRVEARLVRALLARVLVLRAEAAGRAAILPVRGCPFR